VCGVLAGWCVTQLQIVISGAFNNKSVHFVGVTLGSVKTSTSFVTLIAEAMT
jgi:hypothetical protein